MDVAIVGGGIGGLAAGIACRQRGVDAHVFEARSGPEAPAGGWVLWPNGVVVLGRLGLAEALGGVAGALEEVRFVDRRGEPLARVPVVDVGRRLGAPTVVLSAAALHRMLTDALPEDAVSYDHRCTKVATETDGARLTFENGREVSAPIAVGADGLDSRTCAFVRGVASARDAGQWAWIGVSPESHETVPAGAMVGTLGFAQRFCALRLPSGGTAWYALLAPRSSQPLPTDKAALLDVFANFHEPIGLLIGHTPDDEIVSVPVRDRAPGGPWRRGRVALLGDAAHPLTPDLAQGACQALESAFVLGDALASSGIGTTALAAYERLRRRRSEALAHLAHQIARRSMTRNPIEAFFRDVALRVTPGVLTAAELRWIVGGPPGAPALPATGLSPAWPGNAGG